MGLLNLERISVGEVGIKPGSVKMITTDGLSTITTAGYLNGVGNQLQGLDLAPSDVIECLYSYNSITDAGTLAFFQPSISNGVITLNLWENPGNVLLPVVDGDFAVFNGTSGQIKDGGYSPSDATKTKVVMAGSAVVAARIAKFIDTAGTVDDTAGAATNLGDIYAGASGTSGGLRSYPATAARGYLALVAANSAADYAAIITNASLGQAVTWTLGDPAAAASKILQAAGALVSGNFPVNSGTAGLMVDSGVAAANLQNKTNIKAATTGNIGGAGAGPITVTVAGLTAASVVVATIATSSNAVAVAKAVAGTGNFDVTFTGDPGATCTLNYVAFIAAQ